MAQITQCEEGHFFDKSLNRSCPHCGVGTVAARRGGDDHRSDAADEEDKTVQAGPAAKPKPRGERRDVRNDGITQAVWFNKLGIDPVVGWLICHEGANQGRDYRICSGRNVIGRDPSSQICIRGDESISRENHAKIFYDPRNISFHVTEGEGRSGVYVNDKLVLQPTLLEAYDILEIGATKLVFVPLCGPRFQWKEKKAKDGKESVRREAAPDPNDDGDDDVTKAI